MHPTIPNSPVRQRAFTLIELLTVIAIIGILAAILFPSISSVSVSAHKTRVKVMLNEWSAAMEAFRTDYSFYPQIDGTFASTTGAPNLVNPQKFSLAMTGKLIDGTVLPSTASAGELAGNIKRRIYATIPQDNRVMTSSGVPIGIQDAFGNTQIAVLYDANLDGTINSIDKVANGASQTAPPVTATAGGTFTPDPINDVNLNIGIHAGAIFYDPGVGNADNSPIYSTNAVFSWK